MSLLPGPSAHLAGHVWLFKLCPSHYYGPGQEECVIYQYCAAVQYSTLLQYREEVISNILQLSLSYCPDVGNFTLWKDIFLQTEEALMSPKHSAPFQPLLRN